MQYFYFQKFVVCVFAWQEERKKRKVNKNKIDDMDLVDGVDISILPTVSTLSIKE